MPRERSSGKAAATLIVLIAALVVLGLIFSRFWSSGPRLQDVVGNTIRKMELLSEMRLNLLRSEEAEKSAVMADTDEASRDFADQSREAAEIVERDSRELEALLTQDHVDQEMKLFQELTRCWAELRKIDQEILHFAVQNTNIKAADLSFGRGNEAMKRLEHALESLIHSRSPGENCPEVTVPAYDALAAGLKMQVLLAPHIIAASDARMDELEAEMRQCEEIADASLNALAAVVPERERALLQDARRAYGDFAAITAQVIKLSRENTNLKSFELSLGKKRKIAAQCDGALIGMQETVREREFKATR